MKKKIKIVDKISNKVIVKEVAVRDLDHLRAQQTYKAAVHEDKRRRPPKNKREEHQRYGY